MANDYQISKDGTVFQIKEDGTISKLAKIENGKVIVSEEVPEPPKNNTTGKGVLIFFLIAFAITTLVFGILYSEANNNYYSALGREYTLEQQVSSLEGNVASLQNQLAQSRYRITSINMLSSGYVDAEPGSTYHIDYTITPASAKDVTVNWYSTYPSVASVDANGVITAHQKGTTTITARAGGVEAKCVLEVRMKSMEPSNALSGSGYPIHSSYPSITRKSDTEVEIISVDISAQRTAIRMSWTNTQYSDGWYSIDKNTYIQDKSSGEKYTLVTTENCALSPNKTNIGYMQTKEFVLYFPSLPASVTTIDLCEPGSSTWKFYGIRIQ